MNDDSLMHPQALQQIAQWLQAADIDAVTIESMVERVVLSRGPNGYSVQRSVAAPEAPSDTPPATVPPRGSVDVLAGSVGIFLDRHPWRSTPLVQPGDRVQAGATLGLLQIGLVLASVVAPDTGTVSRPLIAPGTIVGYGTPLFDIATGAH
ncbi:MAG: hypothetical protein ABI434_13975 [Burkholderiaceae bacterium]